MTDITEQGPDDPDLAARRVAELARMFETTRQLLEYKIRSFDVSGGESPKIIIVKFNELRIAHLTMLAAEEAFHGEHSAERADESRDLDALRAEIGRKFDRIRVARDPDSVSGNA